MPSKKRKYNARFPAGRIKKIMQTDEEVGKVAQAVPIIISRTLELFVESLISKALQVTNARNAKTLVPSHVKHCILAESRFDFLKDLVKDIPDVSVAEEKEMQMSAENSPNSSRFSDTPAPRKIVREDSNSSSSCDVRLQQLPRELPPFPRENPTRCRSVDVEPRPKIETITSTIVSADTAIDLTTKKDDNQVVQVRTANFYQETLDIAPHRSVIKVNPIYNLPQPSTSSYAPMTPVQPLQTDPPPEVKQLFYMNNNIVGNLPMSPPPKTPVTPILNIDFTKNLAQPEIKVLDSSVAKIVIKDKIKEKVQRQNSKSNKCEAKKDMRPPPASSVDYIKNPGSLQIDEDYDT